MSLIAHWKLDGNADDSSGNGHDGTVHGATSVDGIIDGAYEFDGEDDYIKINDNITSGITQLTVMCWIYPKTGGDNYRCAIHKGSSSAVGNSEYWLGVSGDDYLTATIGAKDDVGWSAGETSISVTYNTWYHLAVTWDGTVCKTYVNGIKEVEYELTSMSPIDYETRFGASSDGDNYQYSGIVDDVRIYDHALSSRDIGFLQSTPPSQKQENEIEKELALWYPFDSFIEPTKNLIQDPDFEDPDAWDDGSSPTLHSTGGVEDGAYLSHTSTWHFGQNVPIPDTNSHYYITGWVRNKESDNKVRVTAHGDYEFDITIDTGGQWTYFETDVDASEDTNDTFNINILDPNKDGAEVEADRFQLEQKDHATPFVDGAREDVIDDNSGSGNEGTLGVNTFPQWEGSLYPGGFGYHSFNGEDEYIVCQNSFSYSTLTFAFWFNAQDDGWLINKFQDTGDGWGVLIRSGELGVYNDIDGVDKTCYSTSIDYDTWYFVVATIKEDGTNILYLDTELKGDTEESSSNTSTFDGKLYIGQRGNDSEYFEGKIADVRVYTASLSDSQIQDIYRQKASIDNRYNLWVHNYIRTGQKLIDYTDWEVGTDGNQSSYDDNTWNANGDDDEQEIIEDTDPWGRTTKMWKCIPDSDDDSDGGWNKLFPANDNTRYRLSVFVKRTGDMDGATYHGCDNSDRTLNLDGSTNGNPYFWSGDPPSLDTWYLLVGLIHPNSYSGDGWGVSGVYDMNGAKVRDGTEYKSAEGIDKQEIRDYLYYCTDTSVRQYFMYPRVDIVDGNEPTIAQLCGGFNSVVDQYYKSGLGEPLSICGSTLLAKDIQEGSNVLDFDGENDYVELDNFNLSDQTIEGWIRSNVSSAGSGADNMTILGNYDGSDKKYLLISIDGSDLRWTIDDGDDSYKEVATSSFSADKWYHVALTYNSDGTTVAYLDGQEIGSIDYTADVTYDSLVYYIGKNEQGGFFDGQVSDVRIWDIVRTQSEIRDNMNKRLNGDESGLVAYYRLDEGEGDTATDSAGSNDGTINGAVWNTGGPIVERMRITSNNVIVNKLIEY